MACLTCLFTAALPPAGVAEMKWYQLRSGEEQESDGYLVSDYTGRITVTFLGDCTLGGEEGYRNNPRGFLKTVEREGYAYPFENLKFLTEHDDLTVVNLEGVLTDKNRQRASKTFTFSGPAAYTEILRTAGIECVSLANNHTYDYGNQGYTDTEDALTGAGIAYFGTDQVAVCELNGIRIGFAGISITLNGAAGTRFREQIETLKKAGCAVVVTVMHAGREYRHTPNVYQKRMAGKAVRYGSDLVIGHHPHVVQGYEIIDGVPVVYSLGNCVFGGNVSPDEYEAAAVQADFWFEDGQPEKTVLRFFPFMISGTDGTNDFRPVFPERDTAERILKSMEDSTGGRFSAWTPEQGAAAIIDIE